MYLNIRGLKFKLESLKEIIDEQKPDIIALVETLLCENDAIELKNYETIRNDREAGGGGVLIAIKKEMKSIVIEDGTCKETTDTLWIRIYNKKKDIRLGVIYNPQESKTTKEDLNKLYKNIEKQVQATRIQGFKSIYLQQPIHFATVLIYKTYSTITRQIEITNNH